MGIIISQPCLCCYCYQLIITWQHSYVATFLTHQANKPGRKY
jgi:hypothetical protein